MEYRRAKTPGATYFFTVVTHQRRKILCQPENVDLLRNAFRYVMETICQNNLRLDFHGAITLITFSRLILSLVQ